MTAQMIATNVLADWMTGYLAQGGLPDVGAFRDPGALGVLAAALELFGRHREAARCRGRADRLERYRGMDATGGPHVARTEG